MVSPAKPLAPSAYTAGLDGIKGLLILFVAFGHMHAVQLNARPVYDLIYIFHVAGFLILPFLLPSPVLSGSFLAKRFVRYAVPFFWFFTLCTVLFYLVFLRHKGVTLPEIGQSYLIGLLTASTHTLDDASGLKLFWFLPALFTLTVLRACWSSLQPLARIPLLIACILVCLLAGDFGDWRYYIPWGLLIAAFIFPAGLVTEWYFHSPLSQNTIAKTLLPLLAVALLCLSWALHISINIGDLTFYSFCTNPVLHLVFLLTMLVVVAAIIQLQGVWMKIPGLAFIGSLSLPVYLIHGLVNQMLEMLLLPRLGLPPLTSLWIIYPLVIAISLTASWIIMKVAFFRQILFPRDATDLCNWYHSTLKLFGFSTGHVIGAKK